MQKARIVRKIKWMTESTLNKFQSYIELNLSIAAFFFGNSFKIYLYYFIIGIYVPKMIEAVRGD